MESRPPAQPSGTAPATAEPFGRAIVVPKLVADAGDKAARRYANFFASIDNDNTRAAYSRACLSFFAWCEGLAPHPTDPDAAVLGPRGS